MNIVRTVAASTITGYQRYLSPHKGFQCAYRARFGGASCSEAVKLFILDHGLLGAYPLIRERFLGCSAAFELLCSESAPEEDDPDDNEYKECPLSNRKYWESPDAICCAGSTAGCCTPF